MNRKVQACFEYDNKVYVFYTENNDSRNLLYGYYEVTDASREIKTLISSEERSMMDKVSKEIFISDNPDNYIKLNTTMHNGKLFQIMYDKISRLKFFYQVTEGEYRTPSEEDVIYLLSVFNKRPKYKIDSSKPMTLGEIHKKKSILEKVIQIGIDAFVVLLLSADFFIILQTFTMRQDTTVYTPPALAASTTEFSIDKVVQAIEGNPNLTESEKRLFFMHNDILKENSQYINMDVIIPILKSFSIDYCNFNGGIAAGSWNTSEKKMTIWESACFEDCNVTVMSHEYVHILRPYYETLGNGLAESITETISNEFFAEDPSNWEAYPENCFYLKMMCEIIGPKPFLQYYFTGDLSYVLNSLEKIIPDKSKAIKLIDSLDNILVYNDEIYDLLSSECGEEETYDKLLEMLKNRDSNHKSIYRALSDYFYVAKGYPIETDAIEMIYYKKLNRLMGYDQGDNIYVGIIDEESGDKVEITGDVEIKKGYFVGDYKAKYPEAVINLWINRSIIYPSPDATSDMDFSLFDSFGNENYTIEPVDVLIDENNRRLDLSMYGRKLVLELQTIDKEDVRQKD